MWSADVGTNPNSTGLLGEVVTVGSRIKRQTYPKGTLLKTHNFLKLMTISRISSNDAMSTYDNRSSEMATDRYVREQNGECQDIRH